MCILLHTEQLMSLLSGVFLYSIIYSYAFQHPTATDLILILILKLNSHILYQLLVIKTLITNTL